VCVCVCIYIYIYYNRFLFVGVKWTGREIDFPKYHRTYLADSRIIRVLKFEPVFLNLFRNLKETVQFVNVSYRSVCICLSVL
jgi:hypothetical protein